MSYFDGIKVGDRVWSCVYGWGRVHAIDHKSNVELIILVTFDMDRHLWHRLDGRPERGCNQTLFWDEVKITPPPKPKRMVKKEMAVMFDRDMESPCVWAKNDTCGPAPHNCVPATIVWEEEE